MSPNQIKKLNGELLAALQAVTYELRAHYLGMSDAHVLTRRMIRYGLRVIKKAEKMRLELSHASVKGTRAKKIRAKAHARVKTRERMAQNVKRMRRRGEQDS